MTEECIADPKQYVEKLSQKIVKTLKDTKDIRFRRLVIETVNDSGIPYMVCYSLNPVKLNKKYQNQFGKKIDKSNNPFLPPLKESLVVTHDLNKKHRLLLNRYPLIHENLMIVAKEFEPQGTLLDEYDIEAGILVRQAVEKGVLFFNCGKGAGASQPHKHLQVVSEKKFIGSNERMPISIAIESHFSNK